MIKVMSNFIAYLMKEDGEKVSLNIIEPTDIIVLLLTKKNYNPIDLKLNQVLVPEVNAEPSNPMKNNS